MLGVNAHPVEYAGFTAVDNIVVAVALNVGESSTEDTGPINNAAEPVVSDPRQESSGYSMQVHWTWNQLT